MFTKGQIVTVYNQTFSGKPIIEGRAKIVRPTGVEDQYKVKFLDCFESANRFVFDGECQTDPQGYIAKAQAEWTESNPELAKR